VAGDRRQRAQSSARIRITGTTATDDVAMRVFTHADGRMRVEFNVKGASGWDAAVANQLSSAYNRRTGR